AFPHDSELILEGSLEGLRLLEVPGARVVRGASPLRQTTAPELDMVAITIGGEAVACLKERLASPDNFEEGGAVVHATLLYKGNRVFLAGAYFHRECVSAFPPASESLFANLIQLGIIRSYRAA